MKNITYLLELFTQNMSDVSKKLENGEMTSKEYKTKKKFFNEGSKLYKKILPLLVEVETQGLSEKELNKPHIQLEELLKKEGLL